MLRDALSELSQAGHVEIVKKVGPLHAILFLMQHSSVLFVAPGRTRSGELQGYRYRSEFDRRFEKVGPTLFVHLSPVTRLTGKSLLVPHDRAYDRTSTMISTS